MRVQFEVSILESSWYMTLRKLRCRTREQPITNASTSLHIVNACRRSVAHQTVVLARSELSLFVELVSALRHLFNLGELKILLTHKVVDGLGVLRGDVVDLSQILLLCGA